MDKKVVVMQILADGHELNEEELGIISNQIDYLISKGIVKKVGRLKRLAFKFFFLFVQRHLTHSKAH
jgi:hypothetical protein